MNAKLQNQNNNLRISKYNLQSPDSKIKAKNSKPKVCVLGTRGFPNVQGGIETHCENLYPRLVEKGCEVIVFTRAGYVDPSLKEYKGVKLISLSCPKNKYYEAFYHTFKGIFAARKINPDILHIHAIGPSIFVPFARLLGFKVVITNHGPDYERKKWNKFAKIILYLGESSGSRWANAVICISSHIAKDITCKYKREVEVIPNGVNIFKTLKTDTALNKYGLKKRKYILAVGRLVPEKGFHDLVEAFEIAYRSWLITDSNDWKLVVAGKADHEDEYSRNLIKKASKNKNIILTGFLTGEPLQELYSHAGLFILPSYHEGLPIVLLEAASYGLSCIASDISANKEVNLSKERFFRVGDFNELALKIKEFFDKPFTEEERKQQINYIEIEYDWEKVAERTLDVYEEVHT